MGKWTSDEAETEERDETDTYRTRHTDEYTCESERTCTRATTNVMNVLHCDDTMIDVHVLLYLHVWFLSVSPVCVHIVWLLLVLLL